MSSARHWLSVQRAAKICCEGEAEGVAVELLLVVALRVAAGLTEARKEGLPSALADAEALEDLKGVAVALELAQALGAEEEVGAADALGDSCAEGEGAGDIVARGEGEG